MIVMIVALPRDGLSMVYSLKTQSGSKGSRLSFCRVMCARVFVCLCVCGWVGGWMYACACMLYVSMMGGGYSEMYTAM